MTHKSDFIQILTARGYLHQASNLEELDALSGETMRARLYWF